MYPTCAKPATGERRNNAPRTQLLDRVRAEFHEMPCLRLTCAQAQRLFGLRSDVSERVLAALVTEGTLRRGADGRYGLRDALVWHEPLPLPYSDYHDLSAY